MADEEVKIDDVKTEDAKESSGSGESSASGESSKEEKANPSWFVKRINREVARRHTAERTAEQALAELANLKSGKAEDGSNTNISQTELDKLINLRAAALVEANQFNAKCNSVFEEGTDEFGDFPKAVEALNSLGIMTKDFLEVVTDLDASHKVLYHLGTNPEEADRIQALSPAKRALALAKLENQLTKPKAKAETTTEEEKPASKISKAPPPVKPVESKSGKSSPGYGTKYYEGMPQEEFEIWDDKNSKRA